MIFWPEETNSLFELMPFGIQLPSHNNVIEGLLKARTSAENQGPGVVEVWGDFELPVGNLLLEGIDQVAHSGKSMRKLIRGITPWFARASTVIRFSYPAKMIIVSSRWFSLNVSIALTDSVLTWELLSSSVSPHPIPYASFRNRIPPIAESQTAIVFWPVCR